MCKKTGSSCEIALDTRPLPDDPVPAMAYVPYQQWCQNDLMDADQALEAGTLFQVLDKPFRRGCGK